MYIVKKLEIHFYFFVFEIKNTVGFPTATLPSLGHNTHPVTFPFFLATTSSSRTVTSQALMPSLHMRRRGCNRRSLLLPPQALIKSIMPFRIVIVSCKKGYHMVKDSLGIFVCHEHYWVGEPVKCVPQALCPRLQISHGSTFEQNGISVYHCDRTYQLIGNKKRRCLSDGSWEGSSAKCVLMTYKWHTSLGVYYHACITFLVCLIIVIIRRTLHIVLKNINDFHWYHGRNISC